MHSSIYNANDYTCIMFSLFCYLEDNCLMWKKALKILYKYMWKQRSSFSSHPDKRDVIERKNIKGLTVCSKGWIPIMFSEPQKDMGRNQGFKSNKKHLS